LDIPLVEILFVIIEEVVYPLAFVVATNGIWWVAHDDHDGGVFFNGRGFVGFLCEVVAKECACLLVVLLEGVGEEDTKALVSRHAYLGVEFEVGDGIRRHHEFEAMQARQQVFGYIAVPCSHLPAEVAFDLSDCLGKESTCTRSGVKDLYAVDLDFLFAVLEVLRNLALDLHFAGVC
jgi:hypothetical protein